MPVHLRHTASASPERPGRRSTPKRASTGPRDLPVLAHGDSTHAQVLRPRGARRQLAIALPSVLPSTDLKASAPRTEILSRLNSPAYVYPYRRFAAFLADADARLGAIVGRYPFDVERSHLLLHAVLSRRTST